MNGNMNSNCSFLDVRCKKESILFQVIFKIRKCGDDGIGLVKVLREEDKKPNSSYTFQLLFLSDSKL